MALKGMSTTLVIIVAAVVILVTALVILTIFGTGIVPVSSLAEAKNQCELQAKTICETTGQLPPTWNLRTIRVGDEVLSCSDSKVCGGSPCLSTNTPNRWVFVCAGRGVST